ncbi:MAG: hypothetical protein IPL58_16715, partial [Betaproteobacteria bacterium]|nr:hypothetical protein [Candidatus Proximibacter danicus]
DATLTAGILDNRNSGQIATAGDLALSADTLVNDGGRVSAGHKLQATIAQGAGNAAGLIVAGTDLGLTAASLDNTAGTLGAVAGSLDANATGAIDNTAGRIEAAQNITSPAPGSPTPMAPWSAMRFPSTPAARRLAIPMVASLPTPR